MQALYPVTFTRLEADRYAREFRTLVVITAVEIAHLELRRLALGVRYADGLHHNARIIVGRGRAGTAMNTTAASVVPVSDDPLARAAPFELRYGFLTEPISTQADLLEAMPLGKTTVLGPLHYAPGQWVIPPGYGLRILVAIEDDVQAWFSGTLALSRRT